MMVGIGFKLSGDRSRPLTRSLARLQARGLLENAGGVSRASGNAWRLTPDGEQVLHASQQMQGAR